ncbi:hypothetical protein EG328_005789 [Venturia inaequalis]|uniref:Uncharacterized protein n=1 Tax=Venturia inaequalis TaxID=5025 RepID=A0A8H3UKH5_VENIN|nr:hypothetical protein EG328_005789 [Venturia inaequalis]
MSQQSGGDNGPIPRPSQRGGHFSRPMDGLDRGRQGLGSSSALGTLQRFGNNRSVTMNRDMNVQRTSQAFNRPEQPEYRSYIDQAAYIRNESEPDWHKKDEAYQRKFLRGMRLEMVDRVTPFGDRSRENFQMLLEVAHANIQHDYRVADDALFQLTYTQLVQFSSQNFRCWMQLDRDHRSGALATWDKVLNRLALEDPKTRRFVRLMKVLQVMQEKSRIFDQEEINLDREAALIVQASDVKSGKTVFELAGTYYNDKAKWTAKPEHYHVLFLNRLISTPTTELQLGVSLHKALEYRARFAKFDRKMRTERRTYWPEPSYAQPDSPMDINDNINYYYQVYSPWNRDQAIHRFTRAWQDLTQQEFPYGHLPYEVALLLALPRIDFPKLPQSQVPQKKSKEEEEEAIEEAGDEVPIEDENDAEFDRSEAEEEEAEEENEDDEGEEEPHSRTHVYSKGDVPFLPDPYPYTIAAVKGHSAWTELQEFLSYVFGVDEGEMAERVVTTHHWNQCRNVIRKRIAYKRTVHRILDPDTISVRNGGVTKIAARIVNGKGNIGRLTDEQLLYNVTWDIDIWRGTMKQSDGADDAQSFPLPPPREIESEMLKKLLVALGRGIPTMDWLITKYPHLPDNRPTRPTWAVRLKTEPNFGQSSPNIANVVAGATATMPDGSTNHQSAALQENVSREKGLARPDRGAHPQFSQQAARPTAPTHADTHQHPRFDSGAVQRGQLGMQGNGPASGFGFDARNEDQKKRGRQADVEGEDDFSGSMPKKNNSAFLNNTLNNSNGTAFTFSPEVSAEGQQPRRGLYSTADVGQGGMRSSQFSLDPLPPALQMSDRPGLVIDENGHATVVMEQRQSNSEDDYLAVMTSLEFSASREISDFPSCLSRNNLNHDTSSIDSTTYIDSESGANPMTTQRGGGDPTNQMADGQQEGDFSANLMNGTRELVPSQAQRLANWFSIDGRNAGQVSDRELQSLPLQQSSSQLFSGAHNDSGGLLKPYSIPVAGGKQQLTFRMSPASASFGPSRPPLLQHNSKTQNYGSEAGAMVAGSRSDTGTSFRAIPRPSMPADKASTTSRQTGFTFPTTWQDFEQRGVQYFGIDGANLSSLSGQPPPPETARLVTPMDPKFPASGISSAGWSKRQLRRIAFLPNTLSLDANSLTGEMIYFLRQFGVSFDDMIVRASISDMKVDWDNHQKRLKQRETQYRKDSKCGWVRCFRVRKNGELTDDSKPKLIGPDAFTKEHFLFNVCWNVDVESQTMWPRVGPSTKYPLPPPRINPKIEKMLNDERMTVPDLNWLRAKYPSLSLVPAQRINNEEGVRATFSSDGEETAQSPSSLTGLQNSGATPSYLITPAVWTLLPTTVIHNQPVYIIGEPIPTYPHVHVGWKGPSCVIAGTRYCEIQDHHTCWVPRPFPPHVRELIAQAKEATDRWRASGLPVKQAASLPSPAEPIQCSNSLRNGLGNRSLGDPAAPQQSFMLSGAQSREGAFRGPYSSRALLIDEVLNGQGDNIIPSPKLGADASEDDQDRRLRDSNRAFFPADHHTFAGNEGQSHQRADTGAGCRSDIYLQHMPRHLVTESLIDSQSFGMSYGHVHGPPSRHSLVGSRAQSNTMAQSGGGNLQVEGQEMGCFGTGSGSNMNNRPGNDPYHGACMAERLGRIDGFAERGTGGFNSGFNDAVGFGAAMRPSSFVGNLSDPQASPQRIHPTLSDGTVGRGVLVAGGESAGESEFADRFLSEI